MAIFAKPTVKKSPKLLYRERVKGDNMPKLVSMERVSLKGSKEVNEKMIQDYIFENPSCLGFGDLTALTKEKTQPAGGRLDLLMADDSNTRYEIEIQLGETDPSHIIRTIEYWDTERKRYKKYDHVAVIVAEEITGRFMNVIQLFNGSIPIVALQLAAYKKTDGELALVFTKVLDQLTVADEEEEEYEATDRKYWEARSTKEQLKVVDSIFEQCEPLKEFEMKYNKFYIGLTKNGIAINPVTFGPRKNYVYMHFYRMKDEEGFGAKLDIAGLTYDSFPRSAEIRVRLNQLHDYTDNKELLDEMAALAVTNKS
jgi:hypothetical protein